MKKISFILFLIFLTSLQLLANGKIVEIDGNVSIQRANTNEWLPAKINMEVNNTDRIRTLFASSAIIKLSDGSNITVAENTVLDLSSIADKKNINVKVVFGGLKANVMKKDLKERAEFRVSTPTAVAGVRGTEFDVLENARGGAKFLVVDGAIEVQSKKGKIELSKGEKIEISADGDLGKIEKAEEKESLVVLTDMIKEKVIELKETLIQEEKKLIEEGKKEEPEKDVKDDTAVEEKKAPIEKQEPSDTQISQPRGELPASAADTAVAATGKEKADTDAAKPKAQDQQKKEDIKAVLTPIITEPIDKTTIYTNRINIRVSAEPNYTIVLKVNNSEVGRQNSRAKEVVFSNIQLRDGQNRISVVGIDPKGATSSEAAININVITAVSAPQIISPAAGQNFDRGPAPTITLASSEFSEWTKRNPMNITGRISYKRQITLPEIKGRWLTAQG
ncbi:MAG TPA: FecR family protein, partial [bacterium]|nr:FecR family protein [bacterium]